MLKQLLQVRFLVLFLMFGSHSYSQDSVKKRLPIIDVHVHAMKVNPAFAMDMCPWFLSSMPGVDPNQPPPAFINTDCAQPLKAAKSDKEFQDSLIATMNRLNMTIIASGDASVIRNWQKAADREGYSKHWYQFIKGHDSGGIY
jgi:hypothetical protein